MIRIDLAARYAPPMLPLPSSDLVRRPQFTVADFFLIIVTGLLGALLGSITLVLTDSTGVVLVAGLLGQQIGHLIGLTMVLRYREASLDDIGFDIVPSDGVYVFAGIGLQLALILLFAPLTSMFADEENPQALSELVPEVDGMVLQVATVLGIALLAPALEEIMFRSVLSQAVGRRLGALATLAVTSLVFAIFHLASVDLSSDFRVILLLLGQLFIAGMVLGRLAQRRGRLGPAIFTHAGFNLIAVIVLLAAPELTG